MKTTQQGMTLVEVLVAFVIFTSSLVAVLDYVANQLFHRQRTENRSEQVALTYQLLHDPLLRLQAGSMTEGVKKRIHWRLENQLIDAVEQRGKTTALYQQNITTEKMSRFGQNKPLKWSAYVVVSE